jgi:hypothetical protein
MAQKASDICYLAPYGKRLKRKIRKSAMGHSRITVQVLNQEVLWGIITTIIMAL